VLEHQSGSKIKRYERKANTQHTIYMWFQSSANPARYCTINQV